MKKVKTVDRLPTKPQVYFVMIKENIGKDICVWLHHEKEGRDKEEQEEYWRNTFEWWIDEEGNDSEPLDVHDY